jgi:hypothetical protein
MHVFDLHKTCKAIQISTLLLSVIQSESLKVNPLFSNSLKTVTMVSSEASTAQEQGLHNSTWEVKFQMFLEFQARNNHVKVTQGNTTQLIYSWVRNERQLCKKYPQLYNPCIVKG